MAAEAEVEAEPEAELEAAVTDAVEAAVAAVEEAELAAVEVVTAGAEAIDDAIAKAQAEDAAVPTPPLPATPEPSPAAGADHGSSSSLLHLQDELLGLLASLDRGLAASADDVLRVDTLALRLQSAGGPVALPGSPLLDGRWRLLYSSGFAGGNLGGARPGPQASLLPLSLGQVHQDIRTPTRELDNCVSLVAKLSLASLPGVDAEPPTVDARLRHTFELVGQNTVRIVFENTVVKASGGLGGWLGWLPAVATPQLPEALRPATTGARSATFDVVFLDERMRVTRGDRGELRVFLKESP